jgi:hypothetical protein
MQTFTRLFSIVTFLLSLGFIAQALPTPANGAALAVRQYDAPASYDDSYGSNPYVNAENGNGLSVNLDVLNLVVELKDNVQVKLALLGESPS